MASRTTARARLGGYADRARGARLPQLAQSLAPLLFLVPVLAGIAVTLRHVLATGHPDLGFATAVNSDAEALYLGHTIYQDPAHGYTGQLYTPLFPFLVSLFHHLKLWAGWGLVLNIAATLSLIGLIARLAYGGGERSRLERLLELGGAVGIGALAWWLVSALPLNVLYDARSDHMAWAFALFGFVLLARGPTASTRTLVGSALLLSAAFWSKQTTVVAVAVALGWVLVLAALGALPWRRALAFCAGVAALNLAVLGALNLATHGWEYYFDFALARRHPRFASFGPSTREFFRFTLPALLLPAVLAAGLAWSAAAERRLAGRPIVERGGLIAAARRWLRESNDLRLASLLVLFVVVGTPAAIDFRLKVGSDVNQYIGVVWATGLLAAIAYRRCRAHALTAALACAAVLALFVAAERPGEMVAGYRIAPLKLTASYVEVPAAARDYAPTHLVYQQTYSDLNVKPQGSLYPNFYNFIDLLAAGRQPGYLVRALLDRRFDAVAPFVFTGPRVALFWEIYASGEGRREANYFWKLNQVIRAGYAPALGLPPGFLGRRPGPSLAPWMRNCFGPFRLAGTRFGIRAGGGFWCREPGQRLVLRRTPARLTEVHALDSVAHLTGALGVGLPRGSFGVSLRGTDGRSWVLNGTARARRGIALTLMSTGRPVGRALVRGRSVALTFRPGTAALSGGRGSAVVSVPDVGAGDVSIVATRGSGARFDLSRVQVRG